MMQIFSKWSIAFLAMLVALTITVPADAQLDRDLRDVFEGMLEDLDKDIRAKFQRAIDLKKSSIEFTPDEFRRFQKSPANPFDGVHDIDPDSLDGNIELKFQLPSLRNRPVSPFEKQHRHMLRDLYPITSGIGQSVVSIQSGYGLNESRIVYGTIVGEGGLILTKASEVNTLEKIVCVLHTGRQHSAEIVRQDKQNDLALLKVQVAGLTPIVWSNMQTRPGGFLVTPNPEGGAIALGVYSSVPRSLASGKQAFLGVRPIEHAGGVRVSDIEKESAAGRAGLVNDDVITKFNNVAMKGVTDLVNYIRLMEPGDEIRIDYLRGETKGTTTATLSGRNIPSERAAQFKMMNRLGAVPSKKSSGFPLVFQHDSPLFPEDCGGPILDLDGNAIGINIARGGRASTYAIPALHLQKVLEELTRTDVASRDD